MHFFRFEIITELVFQNVRRILIMTVFKKIMQVVRWQLTFWSLIFVREF